MPALPSSVIDPLWDQFAALLPEHVDTHPLGCHRPRIPDRVIFDKLVHVLVWGAAYERIADGTCSATSIRNRRDEWITAGVFERLEQICLDAYDRIVGLESRCGRRIDGKPPTACPAWRLSRPGMTAWRPCFACGSDQVPVPIEAALVEVTAAVARVIGGHQGAR